MLTGWNEMFAAARFIHFARHDDGAIEASGMPIDDALRKKGELATRTVRATFRMVTAILSDVPQEVEHVAERLSSKIEIKSSDDQIVAQCQKFPAQREKIFDELAFIDGDAIDGFAGLFAFSRSDGQDIPWILGIELY